MKVGFAEKPPVGFGLTLNGQLFRLVAVEPHRRQDGELTELLAWVATCPDCDAGFVVRTPVGAAPEVKRCPAHRQPGRRVKRWKTPTKRRRR